MRLINLLTLLVGSVADYNEHEQLGSKQTHTQVWKSTMFSRNCTRFSWYISIPSSTLTSAQNSFPFCLVDYFRKGCYKDGSPKSMGDFLGRFPGPDAVLRCYQKVKEKLNKAFGVQNGGDCYTSQDALTSFDKYGAGSDCKDGTGSPTSNDVYFVPGFNPYEKMYPREGCFKDSTDRALPKLLGVFSQDAINKYAIYEH